MVDATTGGGGGGGGESGENEGKDVVFPCLHIVILTKNPSVSTLH